MVRVDKSGSYMYIHDSDHYKEGIMVMPIAEYWYATSREYIP